MSDGSYSAMASAWVCLLVGFLFAAGGYPNAAGTAFLVSIVLMITSVGRVK